MGEENHSSPVRLIGVTASAELGSGGEQLGLFADPQREKQRRVEEVGDEISAIWEGVDPTGRNAGGRGREGQG